MTTSKNVKNRNNILKESIKIFKPKSKIKIQIGQERIKLIKNTKIDQVNTSFSTKNDHFLYNKTNWNNSKLLFYD